jgi:uncharacterized protein involved in exopolysaccharide biosynthesis/Mrp family chromosome partitioning ATPase
MTASLAPLPPAVVPESSPRPAEPPLQLAAYALLYSRRWVAGAAVLGALIGVVLGLMKANSYTSTGTLLLRSGARETETAESAVAGQGQQSARTFDIIANEIEILSHRDLFRSLVQKVGVLRVLDTYDPAAEDGPETAWPARAIHGLQSWWFAANDPLRIATSPEKRESLAIETLIHNLDLEPTGASLIRVSYKAHTPELAKEITDAFLAAAEEHHRLVFSNRTSLDFLTAVEEKARTAAKTARDALGEFRKEHGIYDFDAQRTSVLGDIAKLEAQLAADDEQLQAQDRRCELLRKELDHEPPTHEAAVDAAPVPNPEYTALQQEMFTLETQRTTVRSTVVDIAEMERRTAALAELIADTEARLRKLPVVIPGPEIRRAVPNPRHDRLRTQLDDDQLRAEALRVTRGCSAARLAELRARLGELEQLGPRNDALRDESVRLEGDSKRFLENLKKVEVLNLLDERKLSNMQVLAVGDLPLTKTGPNRARWTMVGAAMGFLVALCAALVRQRLDGHIRRPQDLEAIGIETLAVVPELKANVVHDLGAAAGSGDAAAPCRQLDRLRGSLVPLWMEQDTSMVIAIVADEHSPGGTTLALHLAVQSARRHGLQVLLVETNHRSPSLASRLGLRSGPGFAELACGEAVRDEVVQPTAIAGLHAVHAGTARAAAAGRTALQRPHALLRGLAPGFQVVVLDLPSIVAHPEFRPLASCADRIVPLFAAGRSTRAGARELVQAIETTGKVTSGAILNRWQSVRPFWLPRSVDC